MKKKFKEPKMKVINILNMDVIATSGVTTSRAHSSTATIIIDNVSSSWSKSGSTTTVNN